MWSGWEFGKIIHAPSGSIENGVSWRPVLIYFRLGLIYNGICLWRKPSKQRQGSLTTPPAVLSVTSLCRRPKPDRFFPSVRQPQLSGFLNRKASHIIGENLSGFYLLRHRYAGEDGAKPSYPCRRRLCYNFFIHL
jgi:hypothetical protein